MACHPPSAHRPSALMALWESTWPVIPNLLPRILTCSVCFLCRHLGVCDRLLPRILNGSLPKVLACCRRPMGMQVCMYVAIGWGRLEPAFPLGDRLCRYRGDGPRRMAYVFPRCVDFAIRGGRWAKAALPCPLRSAGVGFPLGALARGKAGKTARLAHVKMRRFKFSEKAGWAAS